MEKEYQEEIEWMIEEEAMELALDEKMKETVLIGMINVYAISLKSFQKLNNDKIKKFYLQLETKKENEYSDNENQILKLINFLNNWDCLVDYKNKCLNKKGFDSYVKLDLEEIKKWEKTLVYAEKKLQLKGITELNNRLQFVLSFNDNGHLRKAYFNFALLKKWKEQEKKKKEKESFRNRENVYETLFQSFMPETDLYNYL